MIVSGTCHGTFTIAKSLTLTGVNGATLDAHSAGTTVTASAGKVCLIDLRITGGSSTQGSGIINTAKLWVEALPARRFPEHADTGLGHLLPLTLLVARSSADS